VIGDHKSNKNERLGLVKTDVLHAGLKDILDYINRLPHRGGPCFADALETIKRIDTEISELSRIVRHIEDDVQ
jgi:hypothetical protein